MKKTLKELLAKLKKYEFECEAGSLVNCKEFIEIEAKTGDVYIHCCLGANHPCALNVNDGYCAADVCQYQVRCIT